MSGHVTMVTVEGGAVAGQIERLQAEVTRLKVEKLELLRQNVSAQVEKIFHDLKNMVCPPPTLMKTRSKRSIDAKREILKVF